MARRSRLAAPRVVELTAPAPGAPPDSAHALIAPRCPADAALHRRDAAIGETGPRSTDQPAGPQALAATAARSPSL